MRPARRYLPACALLLAMLASTDAVGIGIRDTPAQPARHVYRQVDGHALEALVFAPAPSQPPDVLRPAIVLFHGGGWKTGSPAQFARQAGWLSRHAGMVVVLPYYRTTALAPGSSPVEASSDAAAALCWVRDNAGMLGVDARRIAAGGGSAGGQLALSTLLAAARDVMECRGRPPAPAALVLFNPLLDLRRYEKPGQFGRSLLAVSPLHALATPLPHALILQGENDTTAPPETVRRFVQRARELGSDNITLRMFPRRGHGFFNNDKTGDFDRTMRATATFIARLGWLEAPPPTVPAPDDEAPAP